MTDQALGNRNKATGKVKSSFRSSDPPAPRHRLAPIDNAYLGAVMTDRTLEPNTAVLATNTDQAKPAVTNLADRLAKFREHFSRTFWQITDEYGKADTSSFRGLL